MPRNSRKSSKTNVYHIILRGIDKQDIFLSDSDYIKFLNILKENILKYNFDVFSYCLMSNHVHIVIFDKTESISKIIQSIGIKYSSYFNKKYDRVGHLFQDRFLSKEIEDKYYFMRVCRYIHRNPVKAKIGNMEEYRWSSFNEYTKKPKIIKSKILLSLFDEDKNIARKKFLEYHYLSDEQDEYDCGIKFKIDDAELAKKICSLLHIDDVRSILEYSKDIRDKALYKCKKISGITNRQLARVIGINRKMIDRIK